MVLESRELEWPARERDRALVEAHRNGNPDAFADLVREHHRVLLAQAQRRLGSLTEAEDAVQETYERAYRNLGRVRGEYRLGAWLSRIVSNVCADLGSRRRSDRMLPERVGAQVVPHGDASESVSDPALLAQLHTAVADLPATQRHAFLLHEMDGLAYPEVAVALGITEDNARARVHRAKLALRRSIQRGRIMLTAIPFGVAGLARRAFPRLGRSRGEHVSPDTTMSALSRSTASLQSTATQAATQVATSPLGQALTGVAPSGMLRGSVAVGLAAGLLGVAGVLPYADSPAPSARQQTDSVQVAASPASTQTPEPTSTTASIADTAGGGTGTVAGWLAPATASVAAVASTASDWITRALEAAMPVGGPTDEVDGGGDSAAAPTIAAECSWIEALPVGTTSVPTTGGIASASTANSLRTPVHSLSAVGPSQQVESDLLLVQPGSADAPTTFHVSARTCVDPRSPLLVATINDATGSAQLRGTLVLTTTDGDATDYLFRGVATPPDGSALPTGLTDQFVALLQVNGDNTGQLSLAFLGDALQILPTPPADPSPPDDDSSTPVAPPTTSPSAGTPSTPSPAAPSDSTALVRGALPGLTP